MALGRCQDCRETMSDSAESCPHCGSTRRPVVEEVEYYKEEKVCGSCFGKGVTYDIHCEQRLKKRHIKYGKWLHGWSVWRIVSSCDFDEESAERRRIELINNHPDFGWSEKVQNRKIRIEKHSCRGCGGTGKVVGTGCRYKYTEL